MGPRAGEPLKGEVVGYGLSWLVGNMKVLYYLQELGSPGSGGLRGRPQDVEASHLEIRKLVITKASIMAWKFTFSLSHFPANSQWVFIKPLLHARTCGLQK